jgi:uncharacterized protein (DUF433 family)
MLNKTTASISILVGTGSYTAPEAARLLRTPARNINRWLGGYSYRRGGKEQHVPPLWESQLSIIEEHLEIGFRDLVELRFVKAFIEAGLGLLAIRNCLEYARDLVGDERPFSSRRFRTDGKTIFMESMETSGTARLLDLKKRQYAFGQIIERTFKDLDLEEETVSRWRPYQGKKTIVIDPKRAFGQPITADAGVPTVALAEAAIAERSIERVARLFEVPLPVVRDAVRFEASLSPSAA